MKMPRLTVLRGTTTCLLILTLIVVTGCSNEIIVRTDFDKSISIQKLSRYSWLPKANIESRNNPLYYNELNDQRIKIEVDKQLAGKGYLLVESDPGLLVHYHIAVEERSVVRTDDYGYYYGRYWFDARADVQRYSEGTLIVDFMDATNCKLIWRGWAVSILDDSRTVPEEMMTDAIRHIFRLFPESAAQELSTP